MALIDDLVINPTHRTIDIDASPGTFYTARSLYGLLMNLIDEAGTPDLAGAMSLDVPMSAQTPTDFTLINGWYGTQRMFRHLAGGSVQTNGYTNAIRLLSFQAPGYTGAIATDIGKTVTASGGNTGVLLDYDNAARKWWVRSSTTWGNAVAVSITSGTGGGTTLTSNGSRTGEEAFSNLLTIGTIQTGGMYLQQGTSVLEGTGWYGQGNSTGNGSTATDLHLDILVKVREASSLLFNGLVTVLNRANRSATGRSTGDTYDFTTVDLSGLGRNTVALSTQIDTSDTLTDPQISAYVAPIHGGTGTTAQIQVAFGSYAADVDANGVNENYAVQVDCAGQRLDIVYQALKYIARKGAIATLNGEPGQLYRFANPAYNPSKPAPFGTFAGGKFFGAQGVYLVNVPTLDASNYEVIDTAGSRRIPPNFVTVAVTGLVAGDRVLVARTTGGAIDKQMFTLATGNNSGNPQVAVQGTIPPDVPTSGFIRLLHAATQTEQRHQYTGYVAATGIFTLTTPLTRGYGTGDTAYVPFIDTNATGSSASVSMQYVAERTIRTVVRNGAGANKIVPFSVDGTVGVNGFSVPATRTPDTINTSS